MKINQRLKKIEDGLNKKDGAGRAVWDFTNTTTEQLIKLEELLTTEGGGEAVAVYTRQLIGNGFLSHRMMN